MYNISFAIDVFSAIIVFVIIAGLLYSKHTKYKSTKILMVLLAISFISFSFDAIGYVLCNSVGKDRLLFWIYLIPILLTYVIGSLGVWYIVEYMYEKDARNVGKYRFLGLMIGLNAIAVLIVIELVTHGRLFSVSNGQFVAKDLYRWSLYLVSITPIGMFAYIFASARFFKRFEVGRLLTIPVGPIAGYVLEIYFPKISFSIAGVTIAYLVVYILVMENEITGKIRAEEEKNKEIEVNKQKVESYNELYELQQQLEREKERLEVVHKLVHSGGWEAVIRDYRFRELKFSNNFRKMLGYSTEDDFPDNIDTWRKMVFPDDRERAIEVLNDAIIKSRENETYENEYRAYTKNGELHWFKGAGKINIDVNGNGEAFGTFIDTTEIHNIIEMQAIIQAMSEECSCVTYVDCTNNFEHNYYFDTERYERYFEDWESITDFSERLKWLEQFIHPEDVNNFRNATKKSVVQKVLENETTYYVKFRFILGDEEQYWKMKFALANKNLNQLVVGFVCVDEETKAEIAHREELEKARNRAEVASREKTRFLYNMAHDIRTPMNAIIGYADMAERNQADTEKFKDAIEKMKNAGDILMSTVDKVLEISRIEAGTIRVETEICDIEKMFHKYKEAVETIAIEKNVVIEEQLKIGGYKNVYMDTSIMNRIMVNILSNAIKYSYEGGQVTYRLEQLKGDDRDYCLYRFTVNDHGIGMSEEFKENMFEEFAREEKEGTSGVEGNGLGLAIVKKLVELLGGNIRVESQLNEGTCVEINIPLKKARKVDLLTSENDNSVTEYNYKGCRALSVEDNAMNREILKDVLEIYGIEVEEASDGLKAVEMIGQAKAGYYDIVFMDVQMVPMDGYETTKAIRNMQNPEIANIPIVAVTANVFSEDIVKAKESGMDDYMSKPIKKEQISNILLKYIGNK